MKTIFVSGTDTEVGKTYAAAKLARDLRQRNVRVGVYKPVASGCLTPQELNAQFDRVGAAAPDQSIDAMDLISTDALELWEAAGRPLELSAVCPQRFRASLAPNVAARAEDRSVDQTAFLREMARWKDWSEVLIVEGAGGLMSPLADGYLNIDLVNELDEPELVVVAANRLGVLHQTISTCRAAQWSGCEVARVILNATGTSGDSSSHSNLEQLRDLLPHVTIDEIAWQA